MFSSLSKMRIGELGAEELPLFILHSLESVLSGHSKQNGDEKSEFERGGKEKKKNNTKESREKKD